MKNIFHWQPPLSLFLITLLGVVLGANLAGCGASYMGQKGPPPKSLRSLTIDPQQPTVPLGTSQQFIATAWFSDGSKSDVTNTAIWSSAQSKVATFGASGVASAKAVGTTSISAVYQSFRGFSTLTVNPAALVSIAVAPQNPSVTPNHSIQLNATGTFTDGTTQDLTSTVKWSSSPATVVTLSGSGLATAQALGTANITASSNDLSAADTLRVVASMLESISITPSAATIPLGKTQQLSSIGKYNDGSTQDLTDSVQWFSSNSTILSVSASGLATASALGGITVTATSGTVKFATQFQVVAPVAVSISVAPECSVVSLGGKKQLRALAHFSDGTTQDLTTSGIWRSADPTVADVSTPGMVLARKIGETRISVSTEDVSGSANLTVKPEMTLTYFSNAHRSGFADATIRLTNPGVSGGNLCAELYVFDQDQQLSECCGCLVSTDGLLTLSVNKDLTGNPLTGVKSMTGVIKLVSANVSADGSCNPTAVTPDANLLGWSTGIQAKGTSEFAVTETSFQLTPLGDNELAALQSQCSLSSTLGSGQGVCSCGATSVTAGGKR